MVRKKTGDGNAEMEKKKKNREPYLEFTEESSKVKGACVFGTKKRKGILKSECSDDDYADPE